MNDWLNLLRANYNYCLRDRIEAYEQVKSPVLGNFSHLDNQGECCPLTCSVSKDALIGEPWTNKGKKRGAYQQQSSELPQLKQSRPWYKKVHSTVFQQNLMRLDNAFKKFFSEGAGYPKFKNRSKFKSFTYPPGQVKLKEKSIYLPSIGWMKFFQSRPLPDGFEVKSVTLRKKADGWYVSLRLENKTIPEISLIKSNDAKTAIGVDLGINKIAALSNGELMANPRFSQKAERRRKIRHRRASRKKKGSKNRRKAYHKISKLEQKVTNQRTDFNWKLANKLVKSNEIVVFEDLNIKGMKARCKPNKDENGKYLKNGQSQKVGLNRAISDAAWGEIKDKTKIVAAKLGRIVVEIDPKHTSQKCSCCGHISKENRDKEKFLCLECGHLSDADVNASINILERGLKFLNVDHIQLPMVHRKVTALESSCKETSLTLVDEPSNPVFLKYEQLSLFNWTVESSTGNGGTPESHSFNGIKRNDSEA
jgi:putative transposase